MPYIYEYSVNYEMNKFTHLNIYTITCTQPIK